MFTSNSFAEWEKVSENLQGIFYVDFEEIKKVDGYVYWWELGDFRKPSQKGTLSAQVYNQGDCENFRFKSLSFSFHKESMGKGTGVTDNIPDELWAYPPPNTSGETILTAVCAYAN